MMMGDTQMNIPQLHITQVNAQLAIQQQRAHLDMQLKPIPDAELHITRGQLEVNRIPSQLEIDQSEAMIAYGKQSAGKMKQRIHAQLPGIVQQQVAKTARDGDRMANVHESSDVIAELAKELPRELTELTNLLPSNGGNIQVQYRPDQLDISVSQSEVRVHAPYQKPIMTYTPGNIHIELAQKPSIAIEWRGTHVDRVL